MGTGVISRAKRCLPTKKNSIGQARLSSTAEPSIAAGLNQK